MRKMNMNVSDPAVDILEREHTEHKQSYTTTVNRAIQLYDMLMRESRQGTAVVLRTKDGAEREIVFLP